MSVESARREIVQELARLDDRRRRLETALAALEALDDQAPVARDNGSRKRAPRGETQQRVLAHLRKHPEDRGTAIAAALGLTRANVNATLANLKKAGRVRHDGRALVPVE